MRNYFEMLTEHADTLGVSLAQAARQCGVAATTLLRWRKGQSSPRFGTYTRIHQELDRLGVVQQRSQPTRVAQAGSRARR